MTSSRAARAAKVEAWADAVAPEDLRSADTASLQRIATLVAERERIDADVEEAVAAARGAGRSWAQIGLVLGVTKQAAQQRYGSRTPA